MEAQVEDYDIQYFSQEHGLSSLNISTIFQDHEGIIWFGTQDGLVRFDGQAFKVFTKKEHGLISNVFSQIYEDHKNRLWIKN